MLQLGSEEIFMKDSKFLIYGNGKDKPPTGFMFEKEQIKGLYFNQSPTKVFSDLFFLFKLLLLSFSELFETTVTGWL